MNTLFGVQRSGRRHDEYSSVLITLFGVQRSGRRHDEYSSQSAVASDPSMQPDKRLRADQRTGLDCIKQEYQEHHLPAADYSGDPTKRLATNPPHELPPAARQYGQGVDQTSGFGNQPPPYGYWQTSQGAAAIRTDAYPPADLWNSQQQLPVKQEFSSGYPEPGFSQQQQQDYNKSGFESQSAPSSRAVGDSLAYSQMGEWNQGYSQTSQSQIQVPVPGHPSFVDASGAYVTDPAMMSGTAQWGFHALATPKVEPGVPSSTVPYGVSTSLPPPPSLRPPAGQLGLPPATVPSAGLPVFTHFGMQARPPVEFPPSATSQPSMGLPPPPASGQQQLLETGGYGGPSWNNGREQKPDFSVGRQAADGGSQSRPNIPSLLSEEQMNAMRMGAGERGMDRSEDGGRGRDFERNRDSSWSRDRSASDRRDRDRDGGRDFGSREDRGRQGRDLGGGRFHDQSRGDRDRRDFSHSGGRDGARAGRDERDRYDRGHRDRNFGRSQDRDYNRDGREHDRDRPGRDRETDRNSRDGSQDSGRSQRRDDQSKRSSRWGPQEDVKPPVPLDVRPADTSGILGPPPDASNSLNVQDIKTEPGVSAPPGEVSLLGPPPSGLPPTTVNVLPPSSMLPPPVASVRPPLPPALIKADPDAAGGRGNDGILGEMPTMPHGAGAGDVTGGGGLEEISGPAFRGPRPPSGPPPPPGRFHGPPLRGPPPPPPARGGPPPFRGPPPFGGPPMRGMRAPPPPNFGPGIAGPPPPGMPPGGPMPPVRGGPPRWPPRAPGPPRPFR